MTVGSVFSGIGGFDLGFDRAGVDLRWQIEREPSALAILAKHWPTVQRYRDVHLFSGRARNRQRHGLVLEPVDVVCGGFPCQDVSVAGRRQGLTGSRSGLFFMLVRIARLARARWLVIENVPGLLSQHNGRDFSTVLETLRERGFVDGAYRVLDSQFFGVPQRRRRVFLVGHRGDGGRARAVLFESEGGNGHSPAGEATRTDVAATLRGRAHRAGVNAPGRGGEDDVNLIAFNPQSGGDPRFGVSAKQTALSANQTPAIFGVHANQRGELRTSERAGGLTANRSATQFEGIAISSSGERARALTASMHKRHDEDTDTLLIASAITASAGHHGHSSPRGDGSDNLIAATLNSGGNSGGFRTEPGERLIAQTGVRRLTPLECERLQGFPDGWTCLCGEGHRGSAFCGCPDSPRYRGLGNAVTVSVAEWIGQRLARVESANAT